MTPDMIKSMTSSPTKQHTTTSSTIQENDITLENIQEDQTLQMV